MNGSPPLKEPQTVWKDMNNTKWREVFVCLADHQSAFYISFVDNPSALQTRLHRIYLSGIEERGIGDTSCGPLEYKEIHSIKIPKIIRTPKKMRGEIYGYVETEQETDELLKCLFSLGQLPLTETDEFIEIYGYLGV